MKQAQDCPQSAAAEGSIKEIQAMVAFETLLEARPTQPSLQINGDPNSEFLLRVLSRAFFLEVDNFAQGFEESGCFSCIPSRAFRSQRFKP